MFLRRQLFFQFYVALYPPKVNVNFFNDLEGRQEMKFVYYILSTAILCVELIAYGEALKCSSRK